MAARDGARATEPVVRRPRLRRAVLQGVVRYPERLSGPLTYELVQGAGKPGFLPALEALTELLLPRPARLRSSCPTLIVWGATTCSSPSATPSATSA